MFPSVTEQFRITGHEILLADSLDALHCNSPLDGSRPPISTFMCQPSIPDIIPSQSCSPQPSGRYFFVSRPHFRLLYHAVRIILSKRVASTQLCAYQVPHRLVDQHRQLLHTPAKPHRERQVKLDLDNVRGFVPCLGLYFPDHPERGRRQPLARGNPTIMYDRIPRTSFVKSTCMVASVFF